MRIMQIGNTHQDYLNLFAHRFPDQGSHAELMQALEDDYYWCGHNLTPALRRLGHETFFCLPSESRSQQLWCQEQGVPWNESMPFWATLAQITWFQPDVLYVGSAGLYHDGLLDFLPHPPRCIVGWHATTTHPYMGFSHYDLILSSHDECLHLAAQHGARHTAHAYPGVPAELKDRVSREKDRDVCFSGYWGQSHPRRNQFLYDLAKRLPSLNIDCAYHLAFYSDGPPCPATVYRRNRGPVWGMDMFRAFAASRITLNGYATINFGAQNLSPNLRQLEALSVGSFLLTERSDNLEAFFTEGKDLATYASTHELVDKIGYYLAHEEEREAMAAHGLRTCLRYYTMDIRARAFLDAVGRVLHEGSALPVPSLMRALKAVDAACQGSTAAVHSEDAQHIVHQSLEAARALLLEADGTKTALGTALLDLVQTLPDEAVHELQHRHLCQALRVLHDGDTARARELLHKELDRWPENDAARHSLSCLALGTTPWEERDWGVQEKPQDRVG